MKETFEEMRCAFDADYRGFSTNGGKRNMSTLSIVPSLTQIQCQSSLPMIHTAFLTWLPVKTHSKSHHQ